VPAVVVGQQANSGITEQRGMAQRVAVDARIIGVRRVRLDHRPGDAHKEEKRCFDRTRHGTWQTRQTP
jgi:hypothetical protein